ncbi:MAG: NHL repeat-containing protein [Thaumarchaeota archaeon]|nr:NHL repeat-containing protein [Nitrososphaerota archaeon]
MRLRGRTVILIALLVVVPLTAILTAEPAHAGGPIPACPAGTSYDPVAGDCSGSATCPAGFTNAGPKCEGYGTGYCPSGYTYEAVFDSCATCPSGTNFNPLAGNFCSAPPICPPGFANIGPKCEGYGTGYCPSGYTYEAVFDSCATCPSGTNFDPSAGNFCATPAICPSGTTLTGSKCSDGSIPTCPAGTDTTFDKNYDDCSIPSTTTPYLCEAGTYNDGERTCQSVPTCPAGTTFDTAYNVCSIPSTTTPYLCEAGTYNDGERTCQSIPACPSGTSLTAPSYRCIGAASYSCLVTTTAGTLSICVVIGQESLNTLTSGSPPTSTAIGNPTAVAFDSKGDLWVVDASNDRVLEYAPPFSSGEGASLVIGQTSLTGSGDSSPAGGLFGPTGIAFDGSGNLWVVDSGNNRVLEFKSPFSDGEKASLVLGQPTFGGYVGTTSAGGMNSPAYLAFDPSGNLWVTDQGNNRVLEFTAPFSTGQKASVVIGQANFTAFAPASTVTAKSLFEPLGIGFDSGGDLWVVDSADHRVLEYYPPFSTDEAASVVIGQPSLTGGSTGLNAYAIAFDSSGNLWISDGISGVGESLAPLSSGETVSQVIGPKTGTGNATTPGSGLRDPQGIAFDSANNLWVADYSHGRVLEYTSGATASSSSSSSSSSKTSSSSGGGGVPVFPYQFAIASVFTTLLAASFLLIRRRARPWKSGSEGALATS